MLPYDPNEENPDEWGGYVPPEETLQPGWFGEQNNVEFPPPPPPPPPGNGGGGEEFEPLGSTKNGQDPPGYRGGYWDGKGHWIRGEPVSGGGGGGGGGNAVSGPVNYGPAPMLNYPEWVSAGPFIPGDETFEFDPFSYESFTPTSYADLESQPGFAESQGRLQKQIEAGAAHRGMLRSGMTLGDLWTGLDTNKQQRFAEFDGRRARDYMTNRENAFEGWKANVGASRDKWLDEYNIDKDKYAFHATDVDRGNNYRFNVADASFKDALQRWLEQVRSLTAISTAGANP